MQGICLWHLVFLYCWPYLEINSLLKTWNLHFCLFMNCFFQKIFPNYNSQCFLDKKKFSSLPRNVQTVLNLQADFPKILTHWFCNWLIAFLLCLCRTWGQFTFILQFLFRHVVRLVEDSISYGVPRLVMGLENFPSLEKKLGSDCLVWPSLINPKQKQVTICNSAFHLSFSIVIYCISQQN